MSELYLSNEGHLKIRSHAPKRVQINLGYEYRDPTEEEEAKWALYISQMFPRVGNYRKFLDALSDAIIGQTQTWSLVGPGNNSKTTFLHLLKITFPNHVTAISSQGNYSLQFFSTTFVERNDMPADDQHVIKFESVWTSDGANGLRADPHFYKELDGLKYAFLHGLMSRFNQVYCI